MFMSATPTITATGTATIVPSGKYFVVSLENTSVTGITQPATRTSTSAAG